MGKGSFKRRLGDNKFIDEQDSSEEKSFDDEKSDADNFVIVNESRQRAVKNIFGTPIYAVDFMSSTFGPIRLKEVRHGKYTNQDVVDFFHHLDCTTEVVLHFVNNEYSSLAVEFDGEKYVLPTNLTIFALHSDIKKCFKNKYDARYHFFNIQQLLRAAGKDVRVVGDPDKIWSYNQFIRLDESSK